MGRWISKSDATLYAVRAELVEAPFFPLTQEERPFDKLRASGFLLAGKRKDAP